MRSATFAFVCAALLTIGCTVEQDASTLVDEADALLIEGGIELSKNRELAEQKYDRAIRLICGEESLDCTADGDASVKGSSAYNLSHAHFGLAMARSFDLVDRIRQLYVSEIFAQEATTATESPTAVDTADCDAQSNLPTLVPLLRSIINTSLLPIIEDLKAVTEYPNFSFSFYGGFLNLSFLEPGVTGEYAADTSRRTMGFYLGRENDEGGFDEPGRYGLPEVYAILGVMRGITAGAEMVFSYNDLTQALLVFLPRLGVETKPSPYHLAGLLNSDPCYENPLLDPSFGVLTENGRASLEAGREQLTAIFAEMQLGFQSMVERADSEALLDFSAGEWGRNLFERVRIGSTAEQIAFDNVTRLLTGIVSPEDVAELFASLGESLAGNATFNMSNYVEARPELADTLALSGFPIGVIPALRLNLLFDAPVSDLKSIAPLTYVQAEAVGHEPGGRKQVPYAELPADAKNETLYFNDANEDLHWNRRGDFIIQVEREAVYDQDFYTPPNTELGHGIVGTFWDADRNGIPDGVVPDVFPGQGTWYVTAVTSASGVALSATAATDIMLKESDCLKFGFAVKTCLGEDDERVEVGEVLGHMWPSTVPEPFPLPGEFTGRADPANGSADIMYMFFPNPSLSGALLNAETGRSLENQELNAFLNSVFFSNFVEKLNRQ